MTESDSVFSGSIPELYDTYLVPLIFESFAEDLAERVAALSPKSVLETAAGSGVVTRALAPRIRSAERYVVTDLNPEMLNHAEDAQDPQHRIAWRQANALELPFDDDSFDAVCCQFGVMFFPDRVAGYAEARRVLKPGGRFVFNVWDRIEEPSSCTMRPRGPFPTIRRSFSLGPRTAITTSRSSNKSCTKPTSPKSPSSRCRR